MNKDIKISIGAASFSIYAFRELIKELGQVTDIFTDLTIKGKRGVIAMKAKKHFDHIVYDSTNEREFATDLDTNIDVAVYVKLPDGF